MYFVKNALNEQFNPYNLTRLFTHARPVVPTTSSVRKSLPADFPSSPGVSAPLDMSTVPPHLRPHLTPSIRKVYLDLPPRSDKPEASASNTAASGVPYDLSIELARLHAEKEALRLNCSMWKKRAEVHSSATLGMLELSRVARDQVVQVSRDRDTLQRNYLKLKQDFQQQK
jgi:hypothetical protein